jgi:hypothetical protein
MTPEAVMDLEVVITESYQGDQRIYSTIFATIGETMVAAGCTGNVSTVGEVTTGLLRRYNPQAAQDLAQDIGCYCFPVTAERAAEAIEELH